VLCIIGWHIPITKGGSNIHTISQTPTGWIETCTYARARTDQRRPSARGVIHTSRMVPGNIRSANFSPRPKSRQPPRYAWLASKQATSCPQMISSARCKQPIGSRTDNLGPAGATQQRCRCCRSGHVNREHRHASASVQSQSASRLLAAGSSHAGGSASAVGEQAIATGPTPTRSWSARTLVVERLSKKQKTKGRPIQHAVSDPVRSKPCTSRHGGYATFFARVG
jgi:hypothetical protein